MSEIAIDVDVQPRREFAVVAAAILKLTVHAWVVEDARVHFVACAPLAVGRLMHPAQPFQNRE